MIAFVFMFIGCLGGCFDNKEDKQEETAVAAPEPWAPSWETCSYVLDDHACDFTLVDQNGNPWTLYGDDNRGDIILIDLSAMWCGPCKLAAAEAQEIHDLYKDKGFQYVTILIDDAQGEAPDATDALSWAQQYNISSAPILLGSRDNVDYSGENGFPTTSWPTFLLIDRNLVVRWGLHGYSRQMIEEAITALINEPDTAAE